MSQIVFGHHQNSRGILVQSVHDPRSKNSTDSGKIRAMVEKGIDQRPRKVSGRRMHHHSRGLIHHKEMSILIENRQGNRFTLSCRLLGFGKGQGDDIVLFEAHSGLGFFPLDLNVPLLNQAFNLGSR